MMPYIYGWLALVIAVVGLAIRRELVSRHDDKTLHLGAREGALVAEQVTVDRKLRGIDRVGQGLTIMAFVYGLALLGVYLYGVWLGAGKPM